MTAIRKIGIVLLILAVLLFATVIVQVWTNIADTGPWAGKITTYKPPVANHGLWVIFGGIGAAVLFLTGAVMCAMGKR